jgi:hypothetical protein
MDMVPPLSANPDWRYVEFFTEKICMWVTRADPNRDPSIRA